MVWELLHVQHLPEPVTHAGPVATALPASAGAVG